MGTYVGSQHHVEIKYFFQVPERKVEDRQPEQKKMGVGKIKKNIWCASILWTV